MGQGREFTLLTSTFGGLSTCQGPPGRAENTCENFGCPLSHAWQPQDLRFVCLCQGLTARLWQVSTPSSLTQFPCVHPEAWVSQRVLPTLSDHRPKRKQMHSGPTATQRMAGEAAAASAGRLPGRTSPKGHLPAKVLATHPAACHTQSPPGASLGSSLGPLHRPEPVAPGLDPRVWFLSL